MKKVLTVLIIILVCIGKLSAQKIEYDLKNLKIKPKPRKQEKPEKEVPEEDALDFSKESLFKGLFVGGMNLAQIDGDAEFGYRKIGAVAGIGTLVKFHKRMSVSLEMLYSMKGARPRFANLASGNPDKYNVTLNYIELPLSFNVHDKKIIIAGAGLTFAAMMNYKEINTPGTNVTNLMTAPRKFDLLFHVGATFMIKQQFGIGLRFQYSILSLRPATATQRIKGTYNNVLSIRLSYLLDFKKLKKK